jgi:hypothetical protein
MSDEQLKQIERHYSVRSDGDAKTVCELIEEIRRLRRNAGLDRVYVTDRCGILDTYETERYCVHVKLPPIGE